MNQTIQQADGDRPLRLKDHAEVVDTRDEWEGVIGTIEEFVDDDDQPVRADSPAVSAVVLHIPTRPGGGKTAARLYETNELTSYVRAQLRGGDDRYHFSPTSLAWFDPAWL